MALIEYIADCRILFAEVFDIHELLFALFNLLSCPIHVHVTHYMDHTLDMCVCDWPHMDPMKPRGPNFWPIHICDHQPTNHSTKRALVYQIAEAQNGMMSSRISSLSLANYCVKSFAHSSLSSLSCWRYGKPLLMQEAFFCYRMYWHFDRRCIQCSCIYFAWFTVGVS